MDLYVRLKELNKYSLELRRDTHKIVYACCGAAADDVFTDDISEDAHTNPFCDDIVCYCM